MAASQLAPQSTVQAARLLLDRLKALALDSSIEGQDVRSTLLAVPEDKRDACFVEDASRELLLKGIMRMACQAGAFRSQAWREKQLAVVVFIEPRAPLADPPDGH